MDLTQLPIITRLLRQDCPESTKRAVALVAAGVLCLCLIIIILAVYWQAVMDGTVDGTLATVTATLTAAVVTLAGVAYRKKDAPGGDQ